MFNNTICYLSNIDIFLLTQVDKEGFTIFDIAIFEGNADAVKMMLDAAKGVGIANKMIGDMLTHFDYDGFNPIGWASYEGATYTEYFQISSMIIRYAKDAGILQDLLTQVDKEGFTIFDIAIFEGNADAVKMMLDAAKSVGIASKMISDMLTHFDYDGFNPIGWASYEGATYTEYFQISSMIIDYAKDAGVVQNLLTQVDNEGFTIFDIAIFEGNADAVKMMLDAAKSVGIASKMISDMLTHFDYDGFNPIGWASYEGATYTEYFQISSMIIDYAKDAGVTLKGYDDPIATTSFLEKNAANIDDFASYPIENISHTMQQIEEETYSLNTQIFNFLQYYMDTLRN